MRSVSEPAILVERRERVLVITINRPEQRNALNAAVAAGIAAALDQLDGDTELSLGVLTGAGKGFCAGMDLKAFVAGESPYAGDRGFAGITRRAAVKPLIAAVEGFAVAGGLEVALSRDLIVAARGAKLGIPEVKRSLAAGGALLRLPRALPRGIATELALAATKRILTDSVDWAEAEFWDRQNQIADPVMASEDAREGATAFTECRAPVWRGR